MRVEFLPTRHNHKRYSDFSHEAFSIVSSSKSLDVATFYFIGQNQNRSERKISICAVNKYMIVIANVDIGSLLQRNVNISKTIPFFKFPFCTTCTEQTTETFVPFSRNSPVSFGVRVQVLSF